MLSLDDYISQAARKRFVWGISDCCCWGCDWVRDRTGIDPLEPWRGVYSDQKAAIRQYRDKGGLGDLIASRFDALGFKRAAEPETGDVGVVIVPQAIRKGAPVLGPVMAIRYGPRWLVRDLEGIAGFDFEATAAWEIR